MGENVMITMLSILCTLQVFHQHCCCELIIFAFFIGQTSLYTQRIKCDLVWQRVSYSLSNLESFLSR